MAPPLPLLIPLAARVGMWAGRKMIPKAIQHTKGVLGKLGAKYGPKALGALSAAGLGYEGYKGVKGVKGGIQKKPHASKKAKKISSIVKGAGARAVAAGRLAGRVVRGAPGIAAGAAAGKGIILPGTNYLGPGNPMNRPVIDEHDARAREHDLAYMRYADQGHSKFNIYTGYSDADEKLRRESDTTHPSGLASYLGMTIKKGIHKTGLTGAMIRDRKKRIPMQQQQPPTRPVVTAPRAATAKQLQQRPHPSNGSMLRAAPATATAVVKK